MPLSLSGRKGLFLVLITGLLLSATASRAQLVANFSPDISTGCAPIRKITFTNTTTGASNAALYSWDFGDGNTIVNSPSTSPQSRSYPIPGTYTVILTVKDGSKTSSKSLPITVWDKPTVDFSTSDLQGCLPFKATFTSVSAAGSGSIANYFWDFGDGNTLSTTNPTVSNVYTSANTYTISLTVINSKGCSNTAAKKLVTVYPSLTADFQADTVVLCNLHDAVGFQNKTVGPGSIAYKWNFGDGTSSTDENPPHQYTARGTYTVSLTATNDEGCLSTASKPAYVNAANFSIGFSTSAALCTGNALVFKDTSSPKPSGQSVWDFGDGGSALGIAASHTYTAPGTYSVKLIDTFGKCAVDTTRQITISQSPVASPFIVDKGAYCQSPMVVNFKDTSAGITAWHWQFTGNAGDTSNLQNPSFTYATNGIYQPVLTVYNAAGCSSSVTETLNSAQATASIGVDTTLSPSTTACANVNATFHAITQETIGTYLWDFGDGTTSTDPNPTHVYSTPGTYTIKLTFKTIHGCSGTAAPDVVVHVFKQPHASFTAIDSAPCVSNQTEVFTNLDPDAAHFYWYYGDGSNDENNSVVHTHNYADSGWKTITLIASTPGCAPDDTTITKFVKTVPIPAIDVANNCNGDHRTVTITDGTSGASQYSWDFGDATTRVDNTYIASFDHTYPGNGKYLIQLSAVFGSCVQQANTVAYVLGPQKPVLAAGMDTVCLNGSLPVTITGLQANPASIDKGDNNYYDIVTWQYKDGTLLAPQGNTGFGTAYSGNLGGLTPGKDSIRVIVKSRYLNCPDTSNFIPILVFGPTASFTAADKLCYKSPVVFTDASTGTATDPIVNWNWNFGDGNNESKTTNDTAVHYYAFPGTYIPSLVVTDKIGCTDTFALNTTKLIVNGPKAGFSWSPFSVTPGTVITFTNNSQKIPAGTNFSWLFQSDGSTSNSATTVAHAFPNIPYDSVRLIADPGAGGCPDTSWQKVVIDNLAAHFDTTMRYIVRNNCPPLVVTFPTTITPHYQRVAWDFGNDKTSDQLNPTNTYDQPGLYHVTFTAYGANGLTVTQTIDVLVKGPQATLYNTLTQACVPAVDTMYAAAQYADSYTWDFGDGTVLTTEDTFAIHQFTLPGVYTPTLTLADSTGCEVSYPYPKQMILDSIHVSLGDSLIVCDTGVATFNPTIWSMVRDRLGLPLTYHWNFGTGDPKDTADTETAEFKYRDYGRFKATITATSPIGCVDSASQGIHVVAPFSINYRPDTTICPGNIVPLMVEGGYTYTWVADNTLNVIKNGYAIAAPGGTTHYTAVAHDQYSCFTDTAVMHVTVLPVPKVSIEPDITVMPGSSVTLDPTVGPEVVSYAWEPPTDLSCTTCLNPVSTPAKPITYTIFVTDTNGCKASAVVHIHLGCNEGALYVPNAFSPNNDGNNDTFYPSGTGVKIIRKMQVFSRWGELLYSRNDFDVNDHKVGWDGTLNGIPQQAGTYVYLLQAECYTGENFILKGTVELLR